ncbi:alpha/beta fold hydrolase, partial [Pseudomonadota bacterium]
MKKPNLILISGFGPDEKVMKPAIDMFSKYFKVFFYDLPGFGKDKPIENYSVKSLAEYSYNLPASRAILFKEKK